MNPIVKNLKKIASRCEAKVSVGLSKKSGLIHIKGVINSLFETALRDFEVLQLGAEYCLINCRN